MIDFKTAYGIANDFFLNNGYAGIYESRETEECWLFSPKCNSTCYGVSNVCVPKNGDESRIYNAADIEKVVMWNSAKVVYVK